MVDNSILRRNAREGLGSNIFNTNWLILLVIFLLESIIISALSSITMGIAVIFVEGTFTYGLARITLHRVRGKEKFDIEDLFCGFKECWVQSFALGILSYLLIAVWSLLFIIPGIIKAYAYSMAHYIQQDSEDKNWQTCLDKSIQMMNGYKWQLFCLDLSFIGWYILGSITVVGILWVIPYHQMARANFYEALRAEKSM